MANLLHDAFRHHAWANDRLLEVCRSLTPEQLATPCPGTYGPILDTLRHLVGSDRWYLWVITDHKVEEIDEDSMSIDDLPAAAASSAASWRSSSPAISTPTPTSLESRTLGVPCAVGHAAGPGHPPRDRPPKPGLHRPRRQASGSSPPRSTCGPGARRPTGATRSARSPHRCAWQQGACHRLTRARDTVDGGLHRPGAEHDLRDHRLDLRAGSTSSCPDRSCPSSSAVCVRRRDVVHVQALIERRGSRASRPPRASARRRSAGPSCGGG